MHAENAPVKHPVHLHGGFAVSRSDQPKEYLLCAACEQRFSDAEGYVSKLTYDRDNEHHLPLLDHLEPTIEAGLDVQRLRPVIDAAKLAYFAVSVVWRGSVAQSKECQLEGSCEEEIRRYLLGRGSFPIDASILLWAIRPNHDSEAAMSLASPPQTTAKPESPYQVHFFFCHGLFFEMFTGTQFPEFAAACLIRYPERLVLVRDQDFFFDMLAQNHRGTVARGALAKAYPPNSRDDQ